MIGGKSEGEADTERGEAGIGKEKKKEERGRGDRPVKRKRERERKRNGDGPEGQVVMQQDPTGQVGQTDNRAKESFVCSEVYNQEPGEKARSSGKKVKSESREEGGRSP